MPSRASTDSLLSFTGVVTAVFAPYAVLCVTVVAKQPELIILTVGAAFLWLCTISAVAILWWALVPVRNTLWVLVVYGAVLQEVGRWATYALYQRLMQGLRAIGLMPTPATGQAVDAVLVSASIASAIGAGSMQTLVMYGDVLGGALLPGTLYTPQCPTLSVFAVDALQCLAFQLMHLFLSLIGWTAAYQRRSWPLLAAMAALHLLASGTTLLNSSNFVISGSGGCLLALPCLYAVVFATGCIAAYVAASAVRVPPRKVHAKTPGDHADD